MAVSGRFQIPGSTALQGSAYLMSTPKSQGQRHDQISLEVAFDPAPEAA